MLRRTGRRRACARLAVCAALGVVLSAGRAAADDEAAFGFGDITLGESYDALARSLDFRDIASALNDASHKSGKPDLGRRGYGCAPREDAYADVTCVSHEEAVRGETVREFRLQFLDGVLQQFSITAELKRYDDVIAAIGTRYGAPQQAAAVSGPPVVRWRNSVSSISGYAGKDLVFVSFELAGYADAVKNKQRRLDRPLNECR